MSSEPDPRPEQHRLPPRFIQDCLECDVDIGFYDEGSQLLIGASREQLANLRDRAEHYSSPHGPDQLPRGLKAAAKALLKRMDVLDLPNRYSDGPSVMIAGMRR